MQCDGTKYKQSVKLCGKVITNLIKETKFWKFGGLTIPELGKYIRYTVPMQFTRFETCVV